MSNDYIKHADFDKVFALCKPFLEEAGRLTDKAEKLVELYKPQMTAAEEIVPLTNLFFEDFPELTEAEKEVMAGETVPTVLKAFKAKLEAMSDDEFVTENIFPQIKAVQKETGIKGKNSSCQSVLLFQEKCTVQNYQTIFYLVEKSINILIKFSQHYKNEPNICWVFE